MNSAIHMKKCHQKVKPILEETYKNYFIATYESYVGENEIGRQILITTCTWTKGVETIFPHTKYISLMDLDEGTGLHFIPLEKFLKLDEVKFSQIEECGLIYYKGESYPDLNVIEKLLENLQK
jgi:hypothetical protein